MQETLPVINSIVGDVFVFQQDNAPTHRAHCTAEHLCRATSIRVVSLHWNWINWDSLRGI